MQWRASVSEALLLLLGVLVDFASRTTDFKFTAGTVSTLLGFLCTLVIALITNEWMCPEEAESARFSTGVL